jgi:hypothetical protein
MPEHGGAVGIHPGTRIVTPIQFARELVQAVDRDPGAERKAMLFYLDDEEEIAFVRVRSEARITVIEFTRVKR